MFKALVGSVMGKLATVGLLLAGLAGGMAAVNALPFLGGITPAGSVQTPTAGPVQIALDFPTSVIEKVVPPTPAPPVAAPSVAEAVPALPAVSRVVRVAPAPLECVGQIEGLVAGLAGSLPAIVSADQAQAALAQAGSIGGAAQSCVMQATAANGLGLDRLTQMGTQLVGLVTQLQERFPTAPAPLTDPVGGLLNLVGKGLNLTLGGVSKGTELLGEGLGAVLSPGA